MAFAEAHLRVLAEVWGQKLDLYQSPSWSEAYSPQSTLGAAKEIDHVQTGGGLCGPDFNSNLAAQGGRGAL
jgi:hypothetical protein